METLSENRCFGGTQGVYRHASDATGTEMTFGLFLPAEAADGPVPVLWYLSGLNCTHANAMERWVRKPGRRNRGLRLFFPTPPPVGRVWPMMPPMIWGKGPGSM